MSHWLCGVAQVPWKACSKEQEAWFKAVVSKDVPRFTLKARSDESSNGTDVCTVEQARSSKDAALITVDRQYLEAELAKMTEEQQVMVTQHTTKDPENPGRPPWTDAPLEQWPGLEMLRLPSTFGSFSGGPVFAIFREPVTAICRITLGALMTGKGKVLVTGPPGVGKSVGFIPALLADLAAGKAGPVPKVIFYEARSHMKVFKLRLKDNGELESVKFVHIQAWLVGYDWALDDPNTFYLVDPTSKQISGGAVGSPIVAPCRTVVVSSPNNDHFKDFVKVEKPRRLFTPEWEVWDLLAAREFISVKDSVAITHGGVVSVDTLLERWKQQGGNPRALFSDPDAFQLAVDATAARLEAMPEHHFRSLLERSNFRQLDEKDATMPNSAVVTYVKVKSATTNSYDYDVPKIGFLSPAVKLQAANRHSGTMFGHLRSLKTADVGPHGLVYEALACGLLAKSVNRSFEGVFPSARIAGGVRVCEVAACGCAAGFMLKVTVDRSAKTEAVQVSTEEASSRLFTASVCSQLSAC